MKRSLTVREWILLGLLAVIALASAYVTMFYMPMTTRRDSAVTGTEQYRTQIEAAQLRLLEKRRMEQELEEIFAQAPNPVSLAPYDNLQPVMMELHAILAGAEDYSLSFGSVNGEESIVRRSISLTFTIGSYDAAKAILQQLHDSAYRCMLDSVSLSLGQESGGPVTVNTTLVFFEYQ